MIINLVTTIIGFHVLALMIPTVQAEIIRPKVRLELRLVPEALPELRQLLLRFAETHGLQVADVGARLPVSRVMPPVKGRRPFFIELKRRDLELRVTDFMEANRFLIGIYELTPSTEGRKIASAFEELLRNRWPDSLKPFTDP
jgi:hypothetical protein